MTSSGSSSWEACCGRPTTSRCSAPRWTPGRAAGRLKDWQEDLAEWLDDNTACRLDVLQRLRSDGPLPISELPDTCVRPWRSSGWNANRNVTMLLGLLVQRGEVAAAGGQGRERLWDLAERVYPDAAYPDVESAAAA